MTILPGHPIAPPDAPPPPKPPREPRGPRQGSGSRTLVAALAGVVAVAAAGSWYAVHSIGGGTTPASSSAPVVHHRTVPSVHAKLAAPHTKAAAMAAATKIFSVLPAQLPGYRVEGKPTFDAGDNVGADPANRATAKCVAAASTPGIMVDSPDVFHRTPAPTTVGVSAQLGFVRTSARAAADLAFIGRASVRQCVARTMVGRTVSMGHGATLKFTALKPLPVPAHTVALEFDGVISSNVLGDQPVRQVMLFTVVGSTEIVVMSTGLGAALPLATDVRVLNAIVAQTHRVIA